VLSILAAGSALALGTRSWAAARPEPFRWSGLALGAEADVTLYAADRAVAAAAIAASLVEIARLEAIFSLHRPDSTLSQLNRDGRVVRPPLELIELLSRALDIAALSDGRFDPTVQPLWRLVADHFARPDADPAGPPETALAQAKTLVDFAAVEVTARKIAFARPGMAITLNGIAQGYVSDRVGALVAEHGFRNALVNLGETLAIAPKPDGERWRISIPEPGDHARAATEIALEQGAVATSAARGLLFEPTGRFNHIIDPERLACADPARSATILAASAATADGLSTLAALLPNPSQDLPPLLKRFAARALVIAPGAPAGTWIG
jgi:thiamine biosynthesis lipoprotein